MWCFKFSVFLLLLMVLLAIQWCIGVVIHRYHYPYFPPLLPSPLEAREARLVSSSPPLLSAPSRGSNEDNAFVYMYLIQGLTGGGMCVSSVTFAASLSTRRYKIMKRLTSLEILYVPLREHMENEATGETS